MFRKVCDDRHIAWCKLALASELEESLRIEVITAYAVCHKPVNIVLIFA